MLANVWPPMAGKLAEVAGKENSSIFAHVAENLVSN